jgi:hypothetical protein
MSLRVTGAAALAGLVFTISRPVSTAVQPPTPGQRSAHDQVASSTEIGWLEEIAESEEAAAAAWRSQPRPFGQPKDLRVVAYARLGELGTEASIAAQQRVADAFRHRSLIPPGASLAGSWAHPGWHMSDMHPTPIASARGSDGRQWVLVPADMLGEWQLFLLRCAPADRRQCTRAKPVGPWALRYQTIDATLTESAAGRMRLTLIPKAAVRPSVMDGTAPFQPPRVGSAETRELALEEIERDSDGDGWTDIEERTLGLDERRRDSDGDGVDDGHDAAPLLAPTPPDAASDETRILQQAIFTAFGLSESRWALLARDENVPPLEPWGLSAPVLFTKPLTPDPLSGGPGGVYVTWKIVRKSTIDAVVDISDWEGPLAAGGQEITLRKHNQDWVVVARTTTWIS